MRFTRRGSRLAIGLVLGLMALLHTAASPRAEGEDARVEGVEPLLDLANAQRSRAGRAPLRMSAQLMRAAQIQAEQTATLGRLEHVLPGARYPRPQDRLAASGYPWRAFAENIAFGHRTPSEAVEAWMRSPAHRKNLLSPDYTELGTGRATDASGKVYYVQVFGRPM